MTLSHKETLDLIIQAQKGDERAKEILVQKNSALIKSIVKKFVNRGYEYEDLFQIGAIGLIKAIQNYDPRYNVRFSTYAVPLIMGEIKRFLRDDGAVKVSRSLKKIANKALLTKEYLKGKLCREPTIQEIAREIDTSPEDVVHALEAAKSPLSLYDVIYADEDKPVLLMDKIFKEDDEIAKIVDRVTIKNVLSKLDRRERAIIIMRYFQNKTQSDIANKLGISQVQVSRIEKRVLLKMRELM